MLELKIYPEPCLRVKAKPAEEFNDALDKTLRAMADIMYVNKGIGLAATQVGIETRLLVIDVGEGLERIVNPEITGKSKKRSEMEEGCLSIPGTAVNIVRPDEVTVKGQNEKGLFFEKKFNGLMARAIQHEIDHLNGKLIIDYTNPIKRFIVSRKLAVNKRKAQSGKE